MESGVATRPIADLDAYRERLDRFVYRSGTTMEPVFAAARAAPKRVVYADGEDERVLRAAQIAVDEGLAQPDAGRAHRRDDRAHRQAGSAPQVRRQLHGPSTCRTTPATGISGAPTSGSRSARASRARRRRRTCAAGRRSWARCSSSAATPTPCCAAFPAATTRAPALRPHGDRHARRRAHARHDADADPARSAALHLRHARQPRSQRRADRRDDAAAAEEMRRWARSPASRCCRIRASAAPRRARRRRCATRSK